MWRYCAPYAISVSFAKSECKTVRLYFLYRTAHVDESFALQSHRRKKAWWRQGELRTCIAVEVPVVPWRFGVLQLCSSGPRSTRLCLASAVALAVYRLMQRCTKVSTLVRPTLLWKAAIFRPSCSTTGEFAGCLGLRRYRRALQARSLASSCLRSCPRASHPCWSRCWYTQTRDQLPSQLAHT